MAMDIHPTVPIDRISLSPDNTVLFAMRIMAEYHVPTVVLERNGTVVGCLEERAIRAEITEQGRDPEITPIWQLLHLPAAAPGEACCLVKHKRTADGRWC